MEKVTITKLGTSEEGRNWLRVATYNGNFEITYFVGVKTLLKEYKVGAVIEVPTECLK